MRVYGIYDCVKGDYVSFREETSRIRTFSTPANAMSIVCQMTASGKRKKEEFRIDEYELVLSFMGIILNSEGDVVWRSA